MGKLVKLNPRPGQERPKQAPARKAAGPKTGEGGGFLSGIEPKVLYAGGGVLALIVVGVGIWLAVPKGGGAPESAAPAVGSPDPMAAQAAPGSAGADVAPDGQGGVSGPGAAAAAPAGSPAPGFSDPASAQAAQSGTSDLPPGENLTGGATGQTSVSGTGGTAPLPGGAGGTAGGPNASGMVDSQGKVNYERLNQTGLDSGEVSQPHGMPTGPGTR